MLLEAGQVDLVVHVFTAVLATVLFIISILAFARSQKRRMLFVCLAFGLFAVQQFLVVLEVGGLFTNLVVVTHMLSFIILALFFLGMIYMGE